MSEIVISRRGGKKSKGYLMTEYIESSMNWKVPNGVVNNEFNVRIIGGGALGGSYYNYYGGGWMNNDIVRLTPGEYVQITIGNPGINGKVGYTGEATSFGRYLIANGAGESSSGSGGWGTRHRRENERLALIQFGGGGLGQDGGVWGGGGGSSWWWYNGSIPCRPGNGGYYGGGGGGGFPWVSGGNWTTAASISNGGNGGYYGGGGGGAGKIAVSPVLNGTYQPGFVSAVFSKGGIGGIYNYNSNTESYNRSGVAGNGGYVNINSLVFYRIGTNGEYCNDWYWRDGYDKATKYNIHKYTVRAENGTNTIGWSNITKDSIYNNFMNGNGFSGRSNIGNTLFLGEGGGGFGGNGGKIYAPYFNYGNIMWSSELDTYSYSEMAYFSGGGGGGYGSNGGDGILYTGANGGNSPSGDGLNERNIFSLTGGGGGGYGGDGEKSGVVSNGYCGAGGGYGKVSIGKNGGGGGYYCPGSLHINGAGGGIGIWDGNAIVRSYGCGGQKGGCIIQYYLAVD